MHFFEKVHFPAPKRPMCSSPYVFPGQINGLGREKCTFSKKVHFLHFFHFWRKKVSAWWGLHRWFCGPFKMGELFAPKCTLGALGAHGVPELAGWLASC